MLSSRSTTQPMKPKMIIQVFEHEKIYYGRKYDRVSFEEAHFHALVKYNEEHDNRFFTPIHRGIKFSQYVGVIQVGNLTIEILPKADREPSTKESKAKWHCVLFQMLRACRLIRLEGSSEADLRLQQATLLDIFIDLFLQEVEQLIHKGLVKKYRRVEGNRVSLAGSIQFPKHLSQNLVHKERFYVRHQVYDTAHLLHQVLSEALQIVPLVTSNMDLADKVGRIRLSFPEVPRLKITPTTFQKIKYNRKTMAYRKAIDIARLLLLNFSPDIRTGTHHVLAILFDMNELFEEYVFRQLKQLSNFSVSRQKSEVFWERRKIRPDIVVKKNEKTYVLDTKWKILRDRAPAIEDLKQMYAYHHYFGAKATALVYPNPLNHSPVKGKFQKEGYECMLSFVNVVKENGELNLDLGPEIYGQLDDC